MEKLKEKLRELGSVFKENEYSENFNRSSFYDAEETINSIEALFLEVDERSIEAANISATLLSVRPEKKTSSSRSEGDKTEEIEINLVTSTSTSLLSFLEDNLSSHIYMKDEHLTKARKKCYECLASWVRHVGLGLVLEYAVALKMVLEKQFKMEELGTNRTASLQPIKALFGLEGFNEDNQSIRHIISSLHIQSFVDLLFRTANQQKRARAALKGECFACIGLISKAFPTMLSAETTEYGWGKNLVKKVYETCVSHLLEEIRPEKKPELNLMKGCLEGIRHMLHNFSPDNAKELDTLFRVVSRTMKVPEGITRFHVPQMSLMLLKEHASLFQKNIMEKPDVLYKELRKCVLSRHIRVRLESVPATISVLRQIAKALTEGLEVEPYSVKRSEDEASKVAGSNPVEDSAGIDFNKKLIILDYFMTIFSKSIRKGYTKDEENDTITHSDIEIAVRGFGCFARPMLVLHDKQNVLIVLHELFQISDRIDRAEDRKTLASLHVSTITPLSDVITENVGDMSGAMSGSHIFREAAEFMKSSALEDQQAAARSEQIVRHARFLISFSQLIRQLDKNTITHSILDAVITKILGLGIQYSRLLPRDQQLVQESIGSVFYSVGLHSDEGLKYILNRVVQTLLLRSISVYPGEATESRIYNPDTGLPDSRLFFEYVKLWASFFRLRNKNVFNNKNKNKKNKNQKMNEYERSCRKYVCQTVFDCFMENVVKIILIVNLETEKVLGMQEEEDEDDVLASAKAPEDYSYFLNLVELCIRLFEFPDPSSKVNEYLHKWLRNFVTVCVTKSKLYPNVSGFYKLMQVIFVKIEDVCMNVRVEHDEKEQEQDTTLIGYQKEWRFLDKFILELLGRAKLFKDELLASILSCVLKTPLFLVVDLLSQLVPALELALTVGLSHLDTGFAAVNALQRWIVLRSLNDEQALNPYLKQVLPLLGKYVSTSGSNSKELSPEKDPYVSEKARRRLKKQSKSGRYILKRKSFQDPAALERMVLILLGRLGGRSKYAVDPVDRGNKNESRMKWDETKRVLLPEISMGNDIRLDIFLDECLPRIVELARYATDRKTKVAAAELLHGLIVYMIGFSATRDTLTLQQGTYRYHRIYAKIFPDVFMLSVDVENVTRQLFRPLIRQMATWFARNEERENKETIALLNAAVDGLGHASEGALREVCADTLAVFVRYTIKSNSISSGHKSNVNLQSLLRRLYVLMRNPDAAFRMGAALAFDKIYRIIREESHIIDVFVFEIFKYASFSLKAAHSDDRSIETVGAYCKVLDNLCRIICKYSSLLQKPVERGSGKTHRRGFKDFYEVTRYLFQQTSRRESGLREKCMVLFETFCSEISFAGESSTHSLKRMKDKDGKAIETKQHPTRNWINSSFAGKFQLSSGVRSIITLFEASEEDESAYDAAKCTINEFLSCRNHTRLACLSEDLIGSAEAYRWAISRGLLRPSELFEDNRVTQDISPGQERTVGTRPLIFKRIQSFYRRLDAPQSEMKLADRIDKAVAKRCILCSLNLVEISFSYPEMQEYMRDAKLIPEGLKEEPSPSDKVELTFFSCVIKLLVWPSSLCLSELAYEFDSALLGALQRMLTTIQASKYKQSFLRVLESVVQESESTLSLKRTNLFDSPSYDNMQNLKTLIRGYSMLHECGLLHTSETSKFFQNELLVAPLLAGQVLKLVADDEASKKLSKGRRTSMTPHLLETAKETLMFAFKLGWSCEIHEKRESLPPELLFSKLNSISDEEVIESGKSLMKALMHPLLGPAMFNAFSGVIIHQLLKHWSVASKRIQDELQLSVGVKVIDPKTRVGDKDGDASGMIENRTDFLFEIFISCAEEYIARFQSLTLTSTVLCSIDEFVTPFIDSVSNLIKIKNDQFMSGRSCPKDKDKLQRGNWHKTLKKLLVPVAKLTVKCFSKRNEIPKSVQERLVDFVILVSKTLLDKHVQVVTRRETMISLSVVLDSSLPWSNSEGLPDETGKNSKISNVESDVANALMSALLDLFLRKIIVDFPIDVEHISDEDTYFSLLEGLMICLEQSLNPKLLELLYLVIRDGRKHPHAARVNQALATVTRRATLSAIQNCTNGVWMELCSRSISAVFVSSKNALRLRQTLVSWLILPMIGNLPTNAWDNLLKKKQFSNKSFKKLGKAFSLIELLLNCIEEKFIFNTRVDNHSMKRFAFQILQQLYESLIMSDINLLTVTTFKQVYNEDVKGNKLTVFIVRNCKKGFDKASTLLQARADVVSGDEMVTDVRVKGNELSVEDVDTFLGEKELYYTAMFRCWCSVVCRTQSAVKYYKMILKKDIIRVLFPMKHDEPKFTVKTDFDSTRISVRRLLVNSMDSFQGTSLTMHALNTLNSVTQSYALRVDASSTTTQTKAEEGHQSKEDSSTEGLRNEENNMNLDNIELECLADEAESLELDFLNSLPMMTSVIKLLDVIRAKGLLELDKGLSEAVASQSHPFTYWFEPFYEILSQDSESDNYSITLKLFVSKVIMNRPTLFAPFASRLVVPLVSLAISLEAPYGQDRGFHYWLRDICILFGRWDRISHGSVVPSEYANPILSKFLEHLISVCSNGENRVVFMNLKMVGMLIHLWGKDPVVDIDSTMIFDMFDAVENASTSSEYIRSSGYKRVIALNVIGSMAKEGILPMTMESESEDMVNKCYKKMVSSMMFPRKKVGMVCAEVIAYLLSAFKRKECDREYAGLKFLFNEAANELMSQGNDSKWISIINSFVTGAVLARQLEDGGTDKDNTSGPTPKGSYTNSIDVPKDIVGSALGMLPRLQGTYLDSCVHILNVSIDVDIHTYSNKMMPVLKSFLLESPSLHTFESVKDVVRHVYQTNAEYLQVVVDAAKQNQNAECRKFLYGILIDLYKTLQRRKKENAEKEDIHFSGNANGMRSEEEERARLDEEKLREALMDGLNDGQRIVSESLFVFWNEILIEDHQLKEKKGLNSVVNRLILGCTVLSPRRSLSLQSSWINLLSRFMLDLLRMGNDSYNDKDKKLFAHPLSECRFNEVNVDTSWHTSTSATASASLAPSMYSQGAFGMTQPVGLSLASLSTPLAFGGTNPLTIAETTQMAPGMIRATQQETMLRFAPTQTLGVYGSGLGRGFMGTQHMSLFNPGGRTGHESQVASGNQSFYVLGKRKANKRNSQTTATSQNMTNVAFSNDDNTQMLPPATPSARSDKARVKEGLDHNTGTLKSKSTEAEALPQFLTRRFNRINPNLSSDDTGVKGEGLSFYQAKGISLKKRRMAADMRKQEKKRRGVVLYRSYRKGELPDIEICLKELIEPMIALCMYDNAFAQVLLTNLIDAACRATKADITGRSFPVHINVYNQGIEQLLAYGKDPSFVNCLLKIVETVYNHFGEWKEIRLVSPIIIGNCSMRARSFAAGISLLENCLLLTDKEGEKEKERSDIDLDYWKELYRLYEALNEEDMMIGLVERISSHVETCRALEQQVMGNYIAAAKIYKGLIDEHDHRSLDVTANTGNTDIIHRQNKYEKIEWDHWRGGRSQSLLLASKFNKVIELTMSEARKTNDDSDRNITTDALWKSTIVDIHLNHFVTAVSRVPKYNQELVDLIDAAVQVQGNDSFKQGKDSGIVDMVPASERYTWLRRWNPLEVVISELIRKPKPNLVKANVSLEEYFGNFVVTWKSLHPLATASRINMLQGLQNLVDLNDFLRCHEQNARTGWNSENTNRSIGRLIKQWRVSLPSMHSDGMEIWDSTLFVRQLCLKIMLEIAKPILTKEKGEGAMTEINLAILNYRRFLYMQAGTAARQQGALDVASRHIKTLVKIDESQGISRWETQCQRFQLFLARAESNRLGRTFEDAEKNIVKCSTILESLSDSDTEHKLRNMKLRAQLYTLNAFVNEDQYLNNAHTCRQDALEVLRKTVSECLKTKENVPELISQACLDLGMFCDHIIKTMSSSDKNKTMDESNKTFLEENSVESLGFTVVTNYITAAGYGSLQGVDMFPRVLSILLQHHENKAMFRRFQQLRREKCSNWIFLRWTSQILSLLSVENGALIVSELLQDIAREYPHALVSPFRVSKESISANASISPETVNTLKELSVLLHNPLMDSLVAALEGMDNPELRLRAAQQKLGSIFSRVMKLKRDKQNYSRELKNAKRIYNKFVIEDIFSSHKEYIGSKIGTYNRSFAELHKKFVLGFGLGNDKTKDRESEMTLERLKKFLQGIGKICQCHPSMQGSMELERFSEWMSEFEGNQALASSALPLLVPGLYDQYQRPGRLIKPRKHHEIKVVGFGHKTLVMSSLRRPKRIEIRGDDEKSYKFLVKSGEDLRLDQRIEQLFYVMNQIYDKDPLCNKRNLKVKEYVVVPMSTNTGLIEWVDDTEPIRSVLERQYSGHPLREQYQSSSPSAPSRGKRAGAKRKGVLRIEHWKATSEYVDWMSKNCPNLKYGSLYRNTSDEKAHREFERLARMVPSDLLRRQIMSMSRSPEAFISLRQNLARGIACLNISSYMLGIGDRHLDNFLFSNKDASIIPIDFGYSFGIGVTMLRFPELIPFRFTKQFSHLLDPYDHDNGLFKHTMIRCLSALRTRENKDMLINTMQVFLNEKLIDWSTNSQVEPSPVQEEKQEDENSSCNDGDGEYDKHKERQETQTHADERVKVASLKLSGAHPFAVLASELKLRTSSKNAVHHVYPFSPQVDDIIKVLDRSLHKRGSNTNLDLDVLGTDDITWGKQTTDVPEQVHSLISLATDPAILMRQYAGLRTWI